jgi:hypothetical protein
MTVPTLAPRQEPERHIEFRVERRPHFLRVAIREGMTRNPQKSWRYFPAILG